MKRVKRTDDYTIYQRRDERYAVKNAKGRPVNGDEKIRILSEAGLVEAKVPEPAAEPAAEEAPAEESQGEEQPTEEQNEQQTEEPEDKS